MTKPSKKPASPVGAKGNSKAPTPRRKVPKAVLAPARVVHWTELVHFMDDSELARSRLGIWCWMIHTKAFVVLRPAQLGCTPVIGSTLERSYVVGNNPYKLDENIPRTRMLVTWFDGVEVQSEVREVANGLILKYWHESPPEDSPFWRTPWEEKLWNGTRELPEAPGITQPHHSTTVTEMREFLASKGISPSRGVIPAKTEEVDWGFGEPDDEEPAPKGQTDWDF